jgi:hypothetical protein
LTKQKKASPTSSVSGATNCLSFRVWTPGFSRIVAVEFDTFRTLPALDAGPRFVCRRQSSNLLVMLLNCNAVGDWLCKLLINRKLLKKELHRYGFSRLRAGNCSTPEDFIATEQSESRRLKPGLHTSATIMILPGVTHVTM